MKKSILFFVCASAALMVTAQVTAPAPSPFSKVEQKVGLTDVILEYSRPSIKGRTIFGDLVPFGKMWRTGANKNTTITFSTDAMVGGKEIKEGSFAIFTVPGQDSWEVIFYSDTENWGTPREWDDAKVAVKVKVKSTTTSSSLETFTIGFDHLTNSGAHLVFQWENTRIAVPITVPTDAAVSESIKKTMSGPSSNDYYAAAVYYLQEDKDLKQAAEWIDKAIALRDGRPFWMYRQKSLIHAKMGDKKGAIEAAKISLEESEKAGNEDYAKMNKDSLKEWGAL